MLRGFRTAVQYFTVGLALGLLLAPRKGEETRSLVLDQIKSYMQEAMSGAQSAMNAASHHSADLSHDPYGADGA